MDERMEELGILFFLIFWEILAEGSRFALNRFFFFAPGFSSPGTSQREKKRCWLSRCEGSERSVQRERWKKTRKEKKRKGGKWRRSADQRPLKSKKKNNKWFNEMFICSPKSDFRRGIDFLFSSNFPLFEYSLYTNYSLDWELRKKKKKNSNNPIKPQDQCLTETTIRTALIAP